MAGIGGRQTGGFQGRARNSYRSIQQRHRGQRLRPRGTPFIVARGKPPGVVFNEEHSVSRRFISEVKIVAHDDTIREVARCVVGQPVVSHCCEQTSSAFSCDLKSWPMRDFDSTLRCLLQRRPKMGDFGTDLSGQTFRRQRAREERDDGTVLHAARLHRRAKVRNRELSRDLGGPLLDVLAVAKGTPFATRHKPLSVSNVAKAATFETFETQHFRDKAKSAPAQSWSFEEAQGLPETSGSFIALDVARRKKAGVEWILHTTRSLARLSE